MKKIGILTGGGGCPGLNAAIRAVVRKALKENFSIIGIKNGWKGLIQRDVIKLNLNSVSGILPKGGTILGTSRTNPFKTPDGVKSVIKHFRNLGLYCLVVIGGEDTLGVASKLYKKGLNIVGVPKTIDNDLSATDFTFGFDTAVNIATEAIDRLHTTAESHHRIMVVSVYPLVTHPPSVNFLDFIHTLIPFEPKRLHFTVTKNGDYLYRLIYIFIYHNLLFFKN